MARRSDNLREELAALDKEVGPAPTATRRMHKAVPIAISCVALASFSAITWFAYNQGVLEGSEVAAPYLRPKGSLKEAPDSPGGVEVPNRDKFVYNRLEKREDDQKIERVLPPPEQPKERPVAKTQPVPTAPVKPLPEARETVPTSEITGLNSPNTTSTKKSRTANEALKQAIEMVDKGAPPPLAPPGSSPQPQSGTSKITAPEVDAPTAPKQLAQSGAPIRLTPKSNAAEKVTPPPPPPPRAVAKPSVAAPVVKAPVVKPKKTPRKPVALKPSERKKNTSAKGYFIQLGALRSQAAAERAWSAAQKKNANMLRRRSLTVERVSIPGKGVYFRVQSGPFSNANSAKQLCDALKKRKQGCFVVRRK